MPLADHETKLGSYYIGRCEELLRCKEFDHLKGKVQLILTSPPFPLNKKKTYGNLQKNEYRAWFKSLATLFSEMLCDDGSIVVEMGNAWEDGRPIQSLLHLQSLLDFVEDSNAGLRLCQQFIAYNPSRLPSPASWVTIERTRVTDSYTNLWWMAKCDNPKADNKKVLRPYSRSMRALLKRQDYNAGERPSGHKISDSSFLVDNGGSISHNFLEIEPLDLNRTVRLPNVFGIGNTSSNDYYLRECRRLGVMPHPARMAVGLAAYFVQFLTDERDLVLDPFAGSNTTGYVAERLGRKWISIDSMSEFAGQSIIRLSEVRNGNRSTG